MGCRKKLQYKCTCKHCKLTTKTNAYDNRHKIYMGNN